ncbi:MAG TPA: FkbM family methyltransferase [Solirubrobacteraceae bacterium]|jgi:FkbM family methyltransferase|nr:FkbM family methyltransferase [Solirubrobacteraceae bacterium]
MRVLPRGERAVEEAFYSLLEPNSVVYDIGANIGWYSLLAARVVGPGGGVIAFEPSLANAAMVQANAAGNGLENVTVIPAAVSDRDGWATFLGRGSLEGRLDKDDTQAQAERRANRKWTHDSSAMVPVLTLDSWISSTGSEPPAVIKIDVEGAELGVLRGMAETLRSAGPAMIVELHGTGKEVADFLDEIGYEHAPLEVDAPTRDAPWWVHVLARPAGG